MAAFGFGIGDIILGCKGVIAVYQRCHNAPEEIHDVADDVRRMQITLDYLGRITSDESSFRRDHDSNM
jgi:hypothetical protein